MTEDQRSIPVRVRSRTRRWDAERGCFVYDIRFKTRAQLSDRTIEVARSFGLGIDEEKEHVVFRDFELKLADGDVVYITGDSGSGKSVLLRALKEDLDDRPIDMLMVEIDPEKPLIDTVGETFQEALTLLSKVGLNDAFLFLRRYPELSDGQRYRYRIAKMIDSGKKYWLADEFCSTLDRTTARIVAYNIQKLARRSGATLIVATTHTDLEEDLNPSIRIRKGWGEEIKVEYRPNREAPLCTVTRDITIREGSMKDYHRLSHLHYRAEDSRFPIKVYAMERQGELIGVITYNYSPVNTSGRMKAVRRRVSIEELNRDWAIIKRVILHPKYRTTGLGSRLVRETLPLVGRRYVELVAVMAQYNPFAEHAGMKKIQESTAHPKVLEAIEKLRVMGFNPILLASEGANLTRLRDLNPGEVDHVREILLSVPAYKRIRSGQEPYYKKEEMREWLWEQDLQSLAKRLQILSILSETKVYLFWSRDWIYPPEGGGEN
jgi:ABC-type lipoprotein export system ATPase subunit/GNAT superfamily N-acetyltransferase